MAYTLLQLRGLIRQRMGWPAADTFVTDAELNNYVLDSAAELHSLKVNLYPAGTYGTTPFAISTIVGTVTYALPADFGRLVSIRMTIANTLVPIEPFDMTTDLIILDTRSWDYARVKYQLMRGSSTFAEVNFYPPPAAVYALVVFYVQGPPTFPGGDADTSWLGDDEYIIVDCCLKCAIKQEQDPSGFAAQKQVLQARIEQQATPLDLGRGPTVQDVMSSTSREDAWWFRR